MGLKNAGACFQRGMDITLANFHDVARAYIDDVLVYADERPGASAEIEVPGMTATEVEYHLRHIEDTRRVLRELHSKGWRCNPAKCRFGYPRLPFLGHEVSAEGISCEKDKVAAVRDMRVPTNVSELRCFLGLAGYYQRFIPRYAVITEPLRVLLKKDTRWAWAEAQQEAFQAIKDQLSSASFLVQPDYSRPFIVQTVLVQTDYQPLEWLLKTPELRGQYARWAARLGEYNVLIEHRAGRANANADALSRLPLAGGQMGQLL